MDGGEQRTIGRTVDHPTMSVGHGRGTDWAPVSVISFYPDISGSYCRLQLDLTVSDGSNAGSQICCAISPPESGLTDRAVLRPCILPLYTVTTPSTAIQALG